MSKKCSITLDHIALHNESNQLIISIPLDAIWNSIIAYEYAYINAYLQIPLQGDQQILTLFLNLHQKFRPAKVPAGLKRVTLFADFLGIVDKSKQIVGISTIICYNKYEPR